MKTKRTIPNWKPALAVTLAVLMIPALVGCGSRLADRITDEQRAQYQAACNEVKGTFQGNTPWEVPTCRVDYQYPSVPERVKFEEGGE